MDTDPFTFDSSRHSLPSSMFSQSASGLEVSPGMTGWPASGSLDSRLLYRCESWLASIAACCGLVAIPSLLCGKSGSVFGEAISDGFAAGRGRHDGRPAVNSVSSLAANTLRCFVHVHRHNRLPIAFLEKCRTLKWQLLKDASQETPIYIARMLRTPLLRRD